MCVHFFYVNKGKGANSKGFVLHLTKIIKLFVKISKNFPTAPQITKTSIVQNKLNEVCCNYMDLFCLSLVQKAKKPSFWQTMYCIGKRRRFRIPLWNYVSCKSQLLEKFDFDQNAIIVLLAKPPKEIMIYIDIFMIYK